MDPYNECWLHVLRRERFRKRVKELALKRKSERLTDEEREEMDILRQRLRILKKNYYIRETPTRKK